MRHIKLFEELNEGKKNLEDAQDFLENYIRDTFGVDTEYNLDSDDIRGTGKIAFVEVYFDKAKYDEINNALDTNYEEATKHFEEAAEKAGYDSVEMASGSGMSGSGEFISYQVTYKPSFER